MFAFCPLTNQKVCGMSGTTSTDMSITLTEFDDEVIIGPLNLKYTEGDAADRLNTREYDSCYYMITAELSQI